MTPVVERFDDKSGLLPGRVNAGVGLIRWWFYTAINTTLSISNRVKKKVIRVLQKLKCSVDSSLSWIVFYVV